VFQHLKKGSQTFIRLLVIGLLGLASVVVPSTVMAHKIKVFATVEGNIISGYAYLSGGARVKNAAVRMVAADDTLLQETVTDPDGSFQFQAKSPVDHRIIVDAGSGHVADFTIKAAELAGLAPIGAISPATAIDNEPSSQSEQETTLSTATLQVVVDKAVARQLRPLREQLDAYQAEVRWRDVLGGIGYIIGIAGVAFYFLGRHQPPPSS
jgi:nickel transport protein